MLVGQLGFVKYFPLAIASFLMDSRAVLLSVTLELGGFSVSSGETCSLVPCSYSQGAVNADVHPLMLIGPACCSEPRRLMIVFLPLLVTLNQAPVATSSGRLSATVCWATSVTSETG